MALINCSECGKEISDKAAACPNCGNPMSVQSTNNVHNEQTVKCSKCGSDNVAISVNEIGELSQGKLKAISANEHKYKGASINITAKKAVCSNCGNDWILTDKKAHKAYQGMIGVIVIAIALFFLLITTTNGKFF